MMGSSKRDRPCYYIGIATTFHDPALAIVGPTGEVLFAEATERSAQDKRAHDQRPDPILRISQPLRRYCDPEGELIVATTWSRIFTSFLRLGTLFRQFSVSSLRSRSIERSRSLLPECFFWTYGALVSHAQQRAGLGVLMALRECFGHRRIRLERHEHHLTHAMHACLTSPFDDAVCVIVDGMGEFGSLAIYYYKKGQLRQLKRQFGVESLGFFYWLVTDLCGFKGLAGDEWKIMGLAPYGEADEMLENLLRRLCSIKAGKIRVPSKHEVNRIVGAICARVGEPRGNPLRMANLARAGQRVFAENMTCLVKSLSEQNLSDNLILCGGCALNSTFNGQVLRQTGFQRLYVPAAPGDDGNAVGAALAAQRKNSAGLPWIRGQHGRLYPYLGSEVSAETVGRVRESGSALRVRKLQGGLFEEGARLLAEGKVLGWVQGRAEFGPRALGNRSILADPRNAAIKSHINHRVKFREDFRPFAPAVLDEWGSDYFENYQFTPYMERTLRFRPDAAARVPAVVHVDGTGRLQSVTREGNPRFRALIEAFRLRAGVPLLLNTSYNVMNKPMIHTVEDALGLFLTSAIDALVIDDVIIEK